MTPRRLDPDSIAAKLTLMRSALAILASVGDVTADALRRDGILRGAVERYLTLLVDQAVAINLHIAAALGQEVVRDYTASFAAAANGGALSAELADALAASAGMRNVLIHEDTTVELDRVAAAVPVACRDYDRYVTEVARFVASRTAGPN